MLFVQIMMGFVMFVAVVAVVVVINSGGSLDPGRRLTLLPTGTLSSDSAEWGVDALLPHSKRMLRHSVTSRGSSKGVKGVVAGGGLQDVIAGPGSQGGIAGGGLEGGIAGPGSQGNIAGGGLEGGIAGGSWGAEAALTHKKRVLRHSDTAGGDAKGDMTGASLEGDLEGGDSKGGRRDAALTHSRRVLKHSDTTGGGSQGDIAGGVTEGGLEGGRQPPQSVGGGNTSRRRRGLRILSSDVDKSRQLI